MIKRTLLTLALLGAGFSIHASKADTVICPNENILSTSILSSVFKDGHDYLAYGLGNYGTSHQWAFGVGIDIDEVTSSAQAINLGNKIIKQGLFLYGKPKNDSDGGVVYTTCIYLVRGNGHHIAAAITPVPPLPSIRFTSSFIRH